MRNGAKVSALEAWSCKSLLSISTVKSFSALQVVSARNLW